MNHYRDRDHAGIVLGSALARLITPKNTVVLALPRGGVPVARQVARLLQAPLDILVVRKIGAPGHPELACGALASGDILLWNHDVLKSLGLQQDDLDEIRVHEAQELRYRESALRGSATPPLDVRDKSVVIVDDGLATGASMRAAIQAARAKAPDTITVAFPVGPERSCKELELLGCRVVCPLRIENGRFSSVGQWYDDFAQISTNECKRILEEERTRSTNGNSYPLPNL
jgi:predicted phosphoribosyltransferase